jgi:hypothetical protein
MLMRCGQAIDIQICESWTRDHQVLENRTHPPMRMHAASGYLLTATKIMFVQPKRRHAANQQQQTATTTTTTATTTNSPPSADDGTQPDKKQRTR